MNLESSAEKNCIHANNQSENNYVDANGDMKRIQIRSFLLLTFALISSADVFAQVPTPAHVVIVIEENHDCTHAAEEILAAQIIRDRIL
jgi:hypothetical protein